MMYSTKTERLDEIPAELSEKVGESVVNTVGSLIGEELSIGKIETGNRFYNGMIGNITVFNSDRTLSLKLIIPKNTALYFSEVFTGVKLPFESDDMADLIGEVSNILAGDVAANVEQMGFYGQSSLPTATRDSNFNLFMPVKHPNKRMRFSSLNTTFWLTMALSDSY